MFKKLLNTKSSGESVTQQTLSGLYMSMVIALSCGVYAAVGYTTFFLISISGATSSFEKGVDILANWFFMAIVAMAAGVTIIVSAVTIGISHKHFKFNIILLKIALSLATIDLFASIYLFLHGPII